MNDLTKNEILEKILKLLQTDRDMNFLLLLVENDHHLFELMLTL